MTNEEINKTRDEEDKKMQKENENTQRNFSSLGKIEEPNKEDQEEKLEKFRSYLVSDVKKFTTPQLLSQIVEIINTTYVDEVKIRNETDKNDQSEDSFEEVDHQASNIETKEKENICYK
jgi:hypothetical protein